MQRKSHSRVGDLCGIAIGFVLAWALCAPALSAPEDGLVAWYTFDEGPGGEVKDQSGQGNNGKNLGAKYVKAPDGKGYVLAFETADAHVDCGNGAGFDLTDALSIELWVNPQTRIEKGEGGLVGKDLQTYTLGHGRSLWAYLMSEGGKGRTDARTNTTLGAWQHVAAVFDGKKLVLYLDGEPVDSAKAKGPTLRTSDTHFYLRYPVIWGGKVEPTFKCMLDDVRVYNRALSRDEIVAHYKAKAAAMGKDVSGFGTIRLVSHVYPLASTLLVEADYGGLAPLPAGASIALELRGAGKRIRSKTFPATGVNEDKEYMHTTSVCPISAVSADDKAQWVVSTQDIPAGEYEIRATAVDGEGKALGTPAQTTVAVPGAPAWVAANADGKVLNNLVVQLLDVDSPPAGGEARHTIVLPRDGWVYVSCEVAGKARVSVDGEEVIACDNGKPAETMRLLSKGDHALEVRCEEGATLKRLVARSIPEMIFDSIAYRPAPWVKCYGPYDWDFFEKTGILDNVNVFVERARRSENENRAKEWKAQGKRIVTAGFIDWLPRKAESYTEDKMYEFITSRKVFGPDDRDGTLMSEFDGSGYPMGLDVYPTFARVARKISANEDFAGKVWHCYGKFMYYDDRSMEFMKALSDGGYKFAEEIYMQEQPTEKGARQYLDAMMRQRMLRYQALLPGCQEGLIAALAYFSIPCETVNVDPNADYKTFMDIQMNLLANDPVFSGLYGVMWYHSAYASEEAIRWSAKLLRHYGIEGRRDMLATDPYELTHIRNADFRKGAAGWTLKPAKQGGIEAKPVRGFGRAQGRYPESIMGDYALVTTRSAKGPNRFSQRIRNLEPGRLYSVKMFTADHDDMTKGRNTKAPHAASIRLDNVETLPDRSICELFTRGVGAYAKEDRKANRWITYRVVFFRPKGKEALLTISDWASETEPGGPAGRQLIHNFIEIEPYLED